MEVLEYGLAGRIRVLIREGRYHDELDQQAGIGENGAVAESMPDFVKIDRDWTTRPDANTAVLEWIARRRDPTRPGDT